MDNRLSPALHAFFVLRLWGQPAREFTECRRRLVFALLLLGIVGGFAALKYL